MKRNLMDELTEGMDALGKIRHLGSKEVNMKKLYRVQLDSVVAADDSDAARLIAGAACGHKCTVFSVYEITCKEDLPTHWGIDAYPIRSIWKDATIGDILETINKEREERIAKVHVLNSQIAALQKEVEELSKDFKYVSRRTDQDLS